MRFYLITFISFLLLFSCTRYEITQIEPEPIPDPLWIYAEELSLSMDDNLLAAQVLISGIDGNSSLSKGMKELLEEVPAGGIMLFRYNLNANTNLINTYLTEVSSFITDKSGIPPFLSVDHEGGTVIRFPRNTAPLPAASSYWELYETMGIEPALHKIEEDSLNSGRIINAFGINMNFAPVAEHLIDANRSFLESRSYGPDPIFTALAATAFIRGMEKAGILCVVKHFPGSAGPDPHYSPSVLALEKEEVPAFISPFAGVIKNGARAIMAAHTKIPVIDHRIASLSPVVMSDLLRKDLGFTGIIISDDFIMAAAGDLKPEEAAVLSIAAGSDMILVWPLHLRLTHKTILDGLEDGSLSRDRLQNAAQRVIYEKLRMGMIEQTLPTNYPSADVLQ